MYMNISLLFSLFMTVHIILNMLHFSPNVICVQFIYMQINLKQLRDIMFDSLVDKAGECAPFICS